jgi:hypothetical protein
MFSSINLHNIIQRLRKMRPLAALTTVVTVLVGGLLLLPLILLFVFVGFIGMTLLSCQYMRQHRTAPFSADNIVNDRYHAHHNLERDSPNEPSQTSALAKDHAIKPAKPIG